jgi:hypothetical protein
MKNISDIKLGGLYHIPHYMAMYDMVDPKQPDATLSTNKLLSPDLAFVPLELHTVIFAYRKYKKTTFHVHRVKILTTTGEVGWLSLEDSDLPYVFPMTSCDKQL